MSPAAGMDLGPYRILQSIGAGGMGEVYRAHDPRLGRDIAIKVLPAHLADDPVALARLEHEARAVAALNHPNIVTIHSIEEDDGVRFLTMELVEGKTLEEELTVGALPLPRIFDIGIALADALEAAHGKGIIHRDLKPSNVMIAGDGRVKVLDFGLARWNERVTALDDETRGTLTVAGTIIGTPMYMSPEQVEGHPLDGRTDIFSLGVVLFEMITGRRPFHGSSPAALASSILRDDPPPFDATRPDLPGALAAMVARCLMKVPTDRAGTAREVAADLRAVRRAWESGQALPHRATTPGTRLSPELRVVVRRFAAAPDADAVALAEGLADDIMAGMVRFPYLSVAGHDDTDARFAVDGRVRRAGNDVRVSVRLTDTETGAHLWADAYNRSLADRSVFELQDDITRQVVATVADSSGVLARSMAATLATRPIETLNASELVLRYFDYTQHFRAEEHARLRAAFETALDREPDHALGWGILARLYEHEYSSQLNPLPDSLARSEQAAARSIDIDPQSQAGWQAIAALHFFRRDLNGLRMAAARTVALNPLNTSARAFVGMVLAYAGEWDKGAAMVREAIAHNSNHPGWYHYPAWIDYYRRGEYEAALAEAKRANLTKFVWTPIILATAAGALGKVADARAAFETLRTQFPPFVDPERVRRLWALWTWEPAMVDLFVDGFLKARALLEHASSGAQSARPPE